MGRPKEDAKQKFLSQFDVLENGCWKWSGKIHKSTGYGRFRASNVQWHAHRFSYSYYNGEVPPHWHVHHTCENRWCVNPDHLRAIPASEHVFLGNTICANNR